MKKALSAAVIATTLLVSALPASAAPGAQATATEKPSSANVTAPTNQFVTPPSTKSDVSIMSDLSYNFTSLGAGSSIKSSQSIIVPFDQTRDIYLTLTQWTPSSPVPANATYYLVDLFNNKSAGRPVSGDHTSSSTTVGWANVSPGEYKILIVNTGAHELAGNGFANAY